MLCLQNEINLIKLIELIISVTSRGTHKLYNLQILNQHRVQCLKYSKNQREIDKMLLDKFKGHLTKESSITRLVLCSISPELQI